MQTEFTPGPWMCHLANPTGCQCVSVLANGYAGSVATVSVDNGLRVTHGGNDSPPLAEAKANAALIAAAPDLYEALTHMQSCASCAEGGWLDCEGGRQAIAALEKARGEQP